MGGGDDGGDGTRRWSSLQWAAWQKTESHSTGDTDHAGNGAPMSAAAKLTLMSESKAERFCYIVRARPDLI